MLPSCLLDHTWTPPQTTTAAEELQGEHQQQQQQRSPPAIAAPAGGAVSSLQQLPQDIRNATVLLEAPNAAAPGGTTRVYVLGASHVSQVSCRQIKELIRAVRPEVGVGVCRGWEQGLGGKGGGRGRGVGWVGVGCGQGLSRSRQGEGRGGGEWQAFLIKVLPAVWP
jgi:hypothetical protein